MSLEVRTITAAEFPDWVRANAVGFLQPPSVSDELVEMRRSGTDLDRTSGAFDGGRCVATFRSFPQELAVVGGARVQADAVTNVAVLPTHRRRGLLSRMMADDQARAKERGEVVSTLIAAEYPIYGRYGFGPASWGTMWTVEATRAGLDPRWAGPTDGGRIDLVDGATVRDCGPALHERVMDARPGMVNRRKRDWQLRTGEITVPGHPWKEPCHALYRSPEGRVEGLVSYRTDDTWESRLPHCTAQVVDLIATSTAAERALWHYLLSIDWVTKVETDLRAPDDALPLLLPDPRAARITSQGDLLWLRLLDVPRALQARSYRVPATLVLDVHDASGLAGGRFRLDASPEGASCAPTSETADLSLGAGELGALYVGDESARRLADLGRVDEHRAGAVELADLLFRGTRRAWCPDVF